MKYDFTPQLSGTLTVNTDFAQTEADAQQINLSQFSLYFPEKRQFFLDGSSLFAFNNGNMNTFLNGGFTSEVTARGARLTIAPIAWKFIVSNKNGVAT